MQKKKRVNVALYPHGISGSKLVVGIISDLIPKKVTKCTKLLQRSGELNAPK